MSRTIWLPMLRCYVSSRWTLLFYFIVSSKRYIVNLSNIFFRNQIRPLLHEPLGAGPHRQPEVKIGNFVQDTWENTVGLSPNVFFVNRQDDLFLNFDADEIPKPEVGTRLIGLGME